MVAIVVIVVVICVAVIGVAIVVVIVVVIVALVVGDGGSAGNNIFFHEVVDVSFVGNVIFAVVVVVVVVVHLGGSEAGEGGEGGEGVVRTVSVIVGSFIVVDIVVISCSAAGVDIVGDAGVAGAVIVGVGVNADDFDDFDGF